ncbi:MAG: hypothetical protein CMN30_29465 [Sandaracinus sp.]|nr:hypothetical protein [Sandaracinus sp.]
MRWTGYPIGALLALALVTHVDAQALDDEFTEPTVEPADDADAPVDPATGSAPAAVSDPAAVSEDELPPTSGPRADNAPMAEIEVAETDARADGFRSGFAFGSYGRVAVASNLDGGLGRDADIVAFAPRIDEDVYFELELRRQDQLRGGARSFVVATVAFGGPLFHLDGDFDESIAVRNLFAMVTDAFTDGLSLWAGSRMWRGDDVYLLNFWPLDNLNTVGGGLDYSFLPGAHGDMLELRLVGGLARPNDPFHRQVTGAIPTAGFVPDDVVLLDRPRFTAGLKATFWPAGRQARSGLKAILYGEGHFLPDGERELEGGGTETLPRDEGYVLGAQLGGYIADSNTFANLFVKYASGLAVYDPFAVPFTTGSVLRTSRAKELVVALSANYEVGAFGLQLGAYYRWFRDADPNVFDRHSLAEGAIDVRPHVWFGDMAGLSLDLSYQALQASALDETTGQVVRGGITKIGIIPFISPFGRGTYTRPHIRLIYSLTIRDEDAQRLYSDDDPRSQQALEHYLGIGAEWWFDSSSYGS